MRNVRSYAVIVCALVIASSCFDKKIPPNLPPADVAAYKTLYSAIEVEKGLGRAQAAVIQASAAGTIADSFSIPFVKFTRGASITVAAAPAGWQATIATAWTQAKAALSPADRQKYDGYILSIDALLGSIGGTLEPDTDRAVSEILFAVPARLDQRAARGNWHLSDDRGAVDAARDGRRPERQRGGRLPEAPRRLALVA